ncbi:MULTISPECIES: Ppx/GppA phosphatase family protein [unclassified Mesorhizobium]|uniref:Ppx/GppA phosphatase family protein n=1 Tax=unclassified Mesorhizobium TaxID=325217 RepID=UPI000FCB2DE0|nr:MULTISPECIES: Ppx/GppA phosphatase family protein [unclassified Mesorhizobium]RUW71438.1 Ppx/GppA family phosphatase [Mesorhizobium sp. M4B.F.Ca.ET.049.02.1.2]TGV26518.1 Ppx/GppA family phosphatase [Mesorhizobium sp. M4B.F.Ca.ET.143.01.1.1]
MEDHDTGARAPEVGVSRASPPDSASPSAGRHHDRHAGPGGRHAPGDAQQQKGKTRKRRKRRRGRKVFARDDNHAAAAGQAAPGASAPAAQPAPAPPPPAVQGRPVPSGPRPPQHELPVFAALDLGTNNCRLLVAVPTRHGQFRVIDAFSRIVRLGEGLTATGRLGQAAMDRAVEALKVCGEKLRNRKIRKARLIATEACRAAENGVEFLERVEREAGLKLEIIDRQTEARLAVSGCGSLVERDTQGVVLFDIGGGSSEIALIDLTGHRSPRLANHIVSWTSLPVGVVSLAERFGGRTVTSQTFTAMVEDVAARLKSFDGRDRLAHVLASPKFHLLGTSGTVTTLAGVHLDLERYDRRRVDGLWMDRQSVDRMVEKLVGWDFQQRVANPCIGADRADLVLAGCAILEAIRGVWPSERLRVADRGLREGILSELMADDGVWRNEGRGR